LSHKHYKLISVITGYQSEILRIGEIETKATLLALKRLERTEENVRLAEEELDENKFRFEEDRVTEERKSLQWVQEEMQKDMQANRGAGGQTAGDQNREWVYDSYIGEVGDEGQHGNFQNAGIGPARTITALARRLVRWIFLESILTAMYKQS
jgi:hypothetical protein